MQVFKEMLSEQFQVHWCYVEIDINKSRPCVVKAEKWEAPQDQQ